MRIFGIICLLLCLIAGAVLLIGAPYFISEKKYEAQIRAKKVVKLQAVGLICVAVAVVIMMILV